MVKQYKSLVQDSKFNAGDTVDCLDDNEHWKTGEVVESTPDKVKVKIERSHVRWVPNNPDHIVKQWTKGKHFQIYNRIIIQKSPNKMKEAQVIAMNSTQIKVHFMNKSSNRDEWLNKNSHKIMSLFNPLKKENNVSKFTCEKDIQFENALNLINLTIFRVTGDGNCLYRAVSHQLYGSSEHHPLIRAYVVRYITLEKNYFEQFVAGEFEDYVALQSQQGTWGDDIEIQALSEMYGRSFAIYAYSANPMKTFHENARSGEPLKLAYHGQNHYNSIAEISGHVPALTHALPGETEEAALARSRNNQLEAEVLASRDVFDRVDLEETLQASLIEFDQANDLQRTIEESKMEEEIGIQEAINQSLQSNTIQYVTSLGFSLEEATHALEVVGDDPELVIAYILNEN